MSSPASMPSCEVDALFLRWGPPILGELSVPAVAGAVCEKPAVVAISVRKSILVNLACPFKLSSTLSLHHIQRSLCQSLCTARTYDYCTFESSLTC